ncbi:MAG: hypothetical protein KTQ13_04915 [Ferruginibacter sp.]|nr:hypothetical protein [Chitinophagaceae bacterium]MBP6286900.1 hypothetical protein [Ferruginibacter sp.]MBU9935971.1 hypothetical protein [Ferruginibacter sp.]
MKTLLVSITLLLSLCGAGQNKDHLVKANGDTVWGSFRLKNQLFYTAGSDPVQVSASEVRKIKSEYFKGNTVVPCRLLLYTDDIDSYEIDFMRKESVDTIMVLDEIMTTPKINLYYGVSNFRTPFYFYKTPADSLPLQLVIRYFLQGGLANYTNDRPKYMGDKSKLNIVEDKGYVNQLHAIMGDCKKIPSSTWELLSYRGYSFKKLIKQYNKCK